MIVKCFEGRSMPEVMERVRREMGEDAIILHTQQRKGLFWWLRRASTIRVWAAINAHSTDAVRSEIGIEGGRRRGVKWADVHWGVGERGPTLSSGTSGGLERHTPSGSGFVGEDGLSPRSSLEDTLQPSDESKEPNSIPHLPRAQKGRKRKASAKSESTDQVCPTTCHSASSAEGSSTKRHRRSSSRRASVNGEFLELAQRVERQLQLLATSLWGREIPASQPGALGILWRCGVDLSAIQRLFSSSSPEPPPQASIEEWLKSVLLKHLPITGGLIPTTNVAVLVGPTGVGKTTTVAKIAANQLMHQRRRVALVTVDVFRIGAVQQLETYARLMGSPFFVATTPEEAQRCIRQAKQVADLVLVDTIGRSPKHAEQLESLWELVAAMDPDEVLLTLPANGNNADLILAAEKFSIFCPTSLIITKLDEATQRGVIVNLVTHLNLPVSYVTTGQNVPEDLEVPTSERLAEWVLMSLKEQPEVCKSVLASGNLRAQDGERG